MSVVFPLKLLPALIVQVSMTTGFPEERFMGTYANKFTYVFPVKYRYINVTFRVSKTVCNVPNCYA